MSKVSSMPGVYIMKDVGGEVIYVGKAGNLKKRLSSYFGRPVQSSMKTGVLVKKISTFETIITGSEKEALILESNLIKQYKPRYNVILKDDKRYPVLRLDIKSRYPGLSIVRKIKKDDALYFGPFTASQAVRRTLKIINKTFKLRKCKDKGFKNRSRPCLNFQMGACLAPCCFDVDISAYGEMVKEVVLFLKGRTPDLVGKIKQEMVSAAKAQEYEKAAELRDRVFAIEKTLEKQVAITTDFKDRDVLAIAGSSDAGSSETQFSEPRSSEYVLIELLFVRGGYLLGERHFSFAQTMSTDEEMIGSFIRQYYENSHFIPEQILVPIQISDASLLEDRLRIERGKKVSILCPKRGEKVHLVEMAVRNAENRLKDMLLSVANNADMLVRLQKRLKMNRRLERIECFDNSGISGSELVAGMVVFEKAKPKKSSYRKYRIKTVRKQDDYACMAEVLTRRYCKEKESFPDLLIVDGGRGQLNIALSVIKELKLEGKFEIIGIAKKDEKKGETADKIYKPGRLNPVNFGREGDLLLFLQRIRDEAHRFAISYHRKRRSAASIRSVLDTVPGIGKKRKQTLLKHFGSIKKIRAATLEELSALPGMNYNTAKAVKSGLAGLHVGK